MQIKIKGLAMILTFLTVGFLCKAQGDWNNTVSKNDVSRKTIKKKGYTLTFVNKDSTFSKEVEEHLIKTFFEVYPKEVREYNRKASKEVFIIIDPNYKGVAATSGHIVRVNPEWFHKHPQDVDVVTHEVMHIVQGYNWNGVPGWITEGIADFVRNEYGVNNKEADWTLPDYNSRQNYTNAYRVTARFFIWLQQNYDKKLVQELNIAAREKTYTSAFWENKTGKTVDQLWNIYAENPTIKT
ncbi:MAG TPA: basic secretory protein-like protein [Hanamia sp.]